MDKVTIKLAGGMGNYLFQIASAYSYSKKNNKELFLTKDDSVVIHKRIETYFDNILSNTQSFFKKENLINVKVFQENGFHFSEIPNIGGDVYLNGYFQSEKYFKEYRDDVLGMFSYPKDIIENIVNEIHKKYNINILDNRPYCSIHVRRGDYLNSPNHHPTQNMNYYTKAIKQMPKDSVFLIFSDDINWCKENFPDIPEKFVFVEGFKDYEDLLLQKMCKNNVICNSTFSWWGSWLNENPDKIVIFPKQWFGSSYSHYDTKDIYFDGCLII